MIGILFLLMTGCTEEKVETPQQDTFSGRYDISIGSIDITEETWTFFPYMLFDFWTASETELFFMANESIDFRITESNIDEQFALGYNETNDKWMKFWWVSQSDDQFDFEHLICFSEVQEYEESARNQTADSEDLVTGCNESMWYPLWAPLEISGSYYRAGTEDLVIRFNAFEWFDYDPEHSFTVMEIFADEQYLLGMSENFNFYRVQWVLGEDDSIYLCHPNRSDELSSMVEAENYPVSDPTDLEDGCVFSDGSSGRWKHYLPF